MKKRSIAAQRRKKNNRIFTVMMIISGLLMVTGIVFLLIEPIKSLKRSKISDDAIGAVESVMSMDAPKATDADVDEDEDSFPEVTVIVPKNGNEIPGESYDFYGEDESENSSIQSFIQSREDKLPDRVSLKCIGVLKIESIKKQLPVWDNTSRVALRYGVGLYEHSVNPWEQGNATILGHNMKDSTLFSKLYKLSKGDNVKFFRTNGAEIDYVIDDIIIVTKQQLLGYVGAEASETQQLTLVTCANDFGEGHRRVIICRPVD